MHPLKLHRNAAESLARYNALVASGTASQKELTKAKQEMNKDARAETVITRNAAFAYSDQLYFVSLLGVELVSVLIPAYTRLKKVQSEAAASGKELSVFGALSNTFSTFGTNFESGFVNKLSKGTKQVDSDFQRMYASVNKGGATMANSGTAASKFGGVLGSLGLVVGRVAIPLAIITAALAVFATNTFGARDAANQFGASVGNYLQVLKPFGELLSNIAGRLGLTGESADQVTIHFEKATQGFAHMGDLME